MRRPPGPRLPVAGWREWVALPELHIRWIKAKVDTGARSSTLHAVDVERFDRDGAPWVRFAVHPYQHDPRTTVRCEAPLVDERRVRSSAGHEEHRPVVATQLRIGASAYPIELTLTNRDAMGFRMLLGRQALRGRYVVDAGGSYLAAKRPPRAVRHRHRRRRKKKTT